MLGPEKKYNNNMHIAETKCGIVVIRDSTQIILVTINIKSSAKTKMGYVNEV